MSVTRRDLLKMAGAAGVMGMAPAIVRAQKLEKTKVQIAVGGKPLIYYLPLSIAEARGYFKDEGLDVSIADFAGGSKALQAVVGGSADVVSGAFEHTLSMQSKGQAYRAFVLQGRAPMIGVGVSKKNLPNYKGPADLKGKKIGVTAPGSSTNMVVSFFLAKHGLKASDVSIIGVGAGAGAVTALRSGQIDAISNTDPVVSMLEMPGDIQIIVDTRTLKDTQDIFGGNMPAGCLYAPQAFIDANPNTTQALTNALVRADKWIQKAGPDEIAKIVPETYLLGDPAVYKAAIAKSLEGLSPDGMIPEDGAATALKALAAYQADFDGAKIDPSKVWTNDFARRANEKYANG
ncbi:ABC transporter substrate-binding protein [Achromobacter marplatensis]|jgi:NitT/TauT family transport system substrate-binding protein|uniref:ABC transporter substrate-binding protein n=1 Tax=Achromobacter marplatensis TaxID=470868 RepID=J4QXR4_9BURK|nr:ABC transporter substrate-binding protein [Achromobacter marplatensis]EJO33135.1 NMT1/THI5-like domain-containing protein [Achromobacter marplatensis]MDH2052599.1 ABC transporter substrate-binding protein [Achromobacter marplatensis]OWT61595.1 ABC transporter substrate-binding protein [Achromobacter marplatensis]RBP17453.1 NitT/TauT family transport system substrate-binding protein [Achromobacter marplatensis]CAB3695396.1 Putative aliphatic sulfonates-binding protein [Achromobacter marplate